MSGLPKSGHDWAIYGTRPSLTPLADLGRSAGQAPLRRLHAAGIAAANDDAEVGARLRERLHADVGLGGRLGVILLNAQMSGFGDEAESCARPEHYRF